MKTYNLNSKKKRIKFHNEYILQFYNVQFTVYNSYNGFNTFTFVKVLIEYT